jgi:hypothetical protein
MKRSRAFSTVACSIAVIAAALMVRLAEGETPAPDYLKLAREFGDCMIAHGRDRYGKVHSPLLSNILTRGPRPETTPYPLFAELSEKKQADWKKKLANWKGPQAGLYHFHRFDFNTILNYPGGLGSEGPHKVTLFGCDPYEDAELYETLFELTRITGDAKYKQAAEAALVWWFRNTQGPSGLYPWGEHLGWDLVHDSPTYFAGPSKHLYAACYHEIKDTVPFLDILAAQPAATKGGRTPLEKYALGIWSTHFWDKEKAYYCRHGDYLGTDDRTGSAEGYPAHLGAYFRVWAAAYVHSKDATFRAEIEAVFEKVLAMAISRTEKYGFFPFTFAPELKGKSPGKEAPGQSIRLARHAAEVARQLDKVAPEIAAKLRKLAHLHLKGRKPEASAKPAPRFRDLSRSTTPRPHADAILQNVALYRQYKDAEFLKVADRHARQAAEMFCDDTCPLPKARAGVAPPKTTQGEPFPDFYFQGAKLMRAFAVLGEAQRSANSE